MTDVETARMTDAITFMADAPAVIAVDTSFMKSETVADQMDIDDEMTIIEETASAVIVEQPAVEFANDSLKPLCELMCYMFPESAQRLVQYFSHFTNDIEELSTPCLFAMMGLTAWIEFDHQLNIVSRVLLAILNGQRNHAVITNFGSGKTLMAVMTLWLARYWLADRPAQFKNVSALGTTLEVCYDVPNQYSAGGQRPVLICCQNDKMRQNWEEHIRAVYGNSVAIYVVKTEGDVAGYKRFMTSVEQGENYPPDFVICATYQGSEKKSSVADMIGQATHCPFGAFILDDPDAEQDRSVFERGLIMSMVNILLSSTLTTTKRGNSGKSSEKETPTLSSANIIRQIGYGSVGRVGEIFTNIIQDKRTYNTNCQIDLPEIVTRVLNNLIHPEKDAMRALARLFKDRNHKLAEDIACGNLQSAAACAGIIPPRNLADLLQLVLKKEYDTAHRAQYVIKLLNLISWAHSICFPDFPTIYNLPPVGMPSGMLGCMPGMLSDDCDLNDCDKMVDLLMTLEVKTMVAGVEKRMHVAQLIVDLIEYAQRQTDRNTGMLYLTKAISYTRKYCSRIVPQPGPLMIVNPLFVQNTSADLSKVINSTKAIIESMQSNANNRVCTTCNDPILLSEWVMTLCCRQMVCTKCFGLAAKSMVRQGGLMKCFHIGCNKHHKSLKDFIVVLGPDAADKLSKLEQVTQNDEINDTRPVETKPGDYVPHADGKIETLRRIMRGETPGETSNVVYPLVIAGSGIVPIPEGTMQKIMIMYNGDPDALKQELAKYGPAPMIMRPEDVANATKILQQFQDSPTAIAMIAHADTYSAGINLPWITSLVMMHYYSDPVVKAQIAGRGQRLGRKFSLNVYILRYDSEHSEDIN